MQAHTEILFSLNRLRFDSHTLSSLPCHCRLIRTAVFPMQNWGMMYSSLTCVITILQVCGLQLFTNLNAKIYGCVCGCVLNVFMWVCAHLCVYVNTHITQMHVEARGKWAFLCRSYLYFLRQRLFTEPGAY